MQKKLLIEKMIRRRGLTKHSVFNELEVTRPTFIKLINDTNLLNGYQRFKLATALGIPINVIDEVVNLKETEVTELTNEVLNLITPLKND